MVIYISGPITGHAPAICEKRFSEAREELEKKGHFAVSPWHISKHLPINFTHEDYMEIDMDILAKCDAVLMLDGWTRSVGCRMEQRFMVMNGLKKVFYDLDEIPEVDDVSET